MRIATYSHTPSNSVGILVEELESRQFNARRLRTGNRSTFRGRAEDFVINYGSSSTNNITTVVGHGKVINGADAVRSAANKITSLEKLVNVGLPVPEFTTSRRVARDWINNDHLVYCRQETNGHSGSGIVVATNGDEPEHLGHVEWCSGGESLPSCPLFTKALSGRRREMRVHVAFGNVILEQQKRRRDGYAEMDSYSEVVRNYDNGWIYATSNVRSSDAIRDDAVMAIMALGLDFGAVDVVTQGDQHWILEVNTAPGLQGSSSRTAYATAFEDFFNEPELWVLQTYADRELEESNQHEQVEEEVSRDVNRPSLSFERFIRNMEEARREVEDRAAEITAPQSTGPWVAVNTGGSAIGSLSTPDPMTQEQIDELLASGTSGTTVNFDEGEIHLTSHSAAEIRVDPSIAAPATPAFVNSADLPPLRVPAPRSAQPRRPDEEPVVQSAATAAAPETERVAPVRRPAERIAGTGHYVVDLASGARTVAWVASNGTIYTAEHDLVLQEGAFTVVEQISFA